MLAHFGIISIIVGRRCGDRLRRRSRGRRTECATRKDCVTRNRCARGRDVTLREPRQNRRVEQAHLVHHSGVQRGLMESGSGFEHDAEQVAAPEFVEDLVQVQMREGSFASLRMTTVGGAAAGAESNGDHFDAGASERAGARAGCRSASEHQHVAVGGAHKLRAQRKAQAGIEDHADQQAGGAGRPVRSVSSGSSASTVPMPVSMASEAWRMRWTSAREASGGDPAALCPLRRCGRTRWPSSVMRGFQRDEWAPRGDPDGEGFVELARFSIRRCPSIRRFRRRATA